MCGVIGYIGNENCVDFLYEGLKKLEYRGYDSSGIAVLSENSKLELVKEQGKLESLRPLLEKLPESTRGFGHTRWATHGVPSKENAHPHIHDGFAIIHNGILENFKEFKADLEKKGSTFLSETDSEVFAHLISESYKETKDLKESLLKLIPSFKGAFAIGVLSEKEPDAIYLVKQGSPVVIGVGKGENYFASDALALSAKTNKFLFLEDGEFAKVTKDQVEIWDFKGKKVRKKTQILEWNQSQVEKQGHRHYMLKEIHEQPAVVSHIISNFYDPEKHHVTLEKHDLENINWKQFDRIQITACGTAFYAGMIGKYILEPMLKIPVSVELASELRYSDFQMDKSTLFIPITQSGETLDTLACTKLAKEKGAQILSLCNVQFSSIARESDAVIYMGAGPEIGVASTKAFTAMVLNLFFFAVGASEKRGYGLSDSEQDELLKKVLSLPSLMDQALSKEKSIAKIARNYFELTSTLFIGRGMSFPLALEGALKLKETSYIHAEGYAGGELKHGPIALIDGKMAVVSIVPQDGHREKMLSNVEEICARDGVMIGIGDEADEEYQSLCKDYIACPQIYEPSLQVLLNTIPLQLFAYYVAVLRGTDVDQPRNLAKSVTVE